MSDVLIKNVKMPGCCNTCPCCQRVFAWRYSGSYCGATGREIVDQGKINEDCPLVEVPPHGRLIDADDLMGMIHRAKEDDSEIADVYEDDYRIVDEWLSVAPTIIEAEEET